MLILIILFIMIVFLLLINIRDSFKIAYYETRLKIRGVDISEVEYMPWYKLWL